MLADRFPVRSFRTGVLIAAICLAWATAGRAEAADGLLGLYFKKTDLTSLGAIHRGEAVNFAWNGASPDPAVSGSNFSVRWLGSVKPATTETYTFFITGDDGIRLWVNNQLLVDKWIAQGATEYSGALALTANTAYAIRIEYYQGTGGAVCKLAWQTPTIAKQVVPVTALALPVDTTAPGAITGLAATHATDKAVTLAWTAATDNYLMGLNTIARNGAVIATTGDATFTDTTVAASTSYTYTVQPVDALGNAGPVSSALAVTTTAAPPTGTGTGLAATYYSDMSLSVVAKQRTDATVDFSWPSGVAPDPAVPATLFSTSWRGTVQARYSETYTFSAVVDTNLRLWVNGTLVIDAWQWGNSSGALPMPQNLSASVALTAGQKTAIRIDYLKRNASGQVHLSWQSLSQPKAIVPAAQLYPAPPSDPLADDLLSGLASPTSPAWFEGLAGAPTSTVGVAIGGTAVPVVHENARQWYASNAPAGKPAGIVMSAGQSTAVVVTTTAGGTASSATKTLTWAVTNLTGLAAASSSIVVRPGDSLLLTATQAGGAAGGTLAIDPAYNGTTFAAAYTGTGGTGIPVAFANPGAVTVAAQVNGVLAGTITVRVASVNLQGPIACQVNYQRSKTVTLGSGTTGLAFASSDPERCTVAANGAVLAIRPLYLGDYAIQARLGSASGPLLASQALDDFVYSTTAATHVTYVKTFPDKSMLVQAVISMQPLVPNLTLTMNTIVAGVTFADSTTSTSISSNAFTVVGDHGEYTYQLIVAPTVTGHICHNIRVYQGGVQVSQ